MKLLEAMDKDGRYTALQDTQGITYSGCGLNLQ
jgi:hypothetical protein